jgi:hypothetical protein
MEVKITKSVPLWLSNILADLKIYKTSFSKYGTEYKKYYSGVKENESNAIYSAISKSYAKEDNIVHSQRPCVNY